MKKLSNPARAALGLGSLAMLAAYFLPLWQIQLWAPQYPEGLNMKIWHNRLSGAFDIINGLNHYIGMREIRAEMFPEFQYIGILIGLFIAVGLVAALVGTRRWLLIFTGMAYLYGVAALYDFYRWGYDYGHNLNPHAAIVVPGMSYQPPVVGYKNLLNFTAYSGPDTGAWVIIAVGVMASCLAVYELFFKDKKARASHATLTGLAAVSMLFPSCASGPEPIRYGQDECAHCKMTLTDRRFGAELLTAKGKVFKFDDLNCMAAFAEKGSVAQADIAQLLAVDFSQKGQFVDVRQAFFLRNEAIKSPMRGDVAAFSSAAGRDAVKQQLGGGEEMDWEGAKQSF